MNEYKRQLERELSHISHDLNDEDIIIRSMKYYEMLMKIGSKMNLASISGIEDFIYRHFIDSITILKHIDIINGAMIADIGSGPGFPGIPIKIVRPDLRLTSIESIKKKADFQIDTLSALGYEDWTVINGRAEEVGRGNKRDQIDIVMARAVTSLPVLIEYTLPLLKQGGRAVLHRGITAKSDAIDARKAIDEMGGSLEEVIPYKLVGLEEGRGEFSLVVIKKIHVTPDRYPRRPGIPEKRPLT